MSKSLGTAVKEGIPLALLAKIVARLKRQHGGEKLLRITPASVALIRTAKDRLGFSTDFPVLTDTERKKQEEAVEAEESTLPGER